jgi:teichoic acid transport system ATP-binding protein
MVESNALTAEPDTAAPRLTVTVRELVVNFKVYEQPVLSARQLATRGFRSRVSSTVEALKSINLDFVAGEAVGLVGSNGSGKSTFLRTIAGLQPKTGGHVFVSGRR